MICKKISSKITFIPAVISVGLFGLGLIVNLIMLFINYNWWLVLPFNILPFAFVFWLLITMCYVVEFFDDKLIFKTILGKTVKEVAKEEIKAISYRQEDIPVHGYWLRFYVFDLSHDKKYLVSPFQLEVTQKNEKLLKEHFPNLEIPRFDYFEPR